ncbi:MAG TPA: F0F1 ATP synthase subunit B [Coleofasciculaceae cyanobacterium]
MTNVFLGSIAPHLLAHGGFGINTDILETNLINLLIVIGVLVYFGRGFLGNLLGTRRATIEAAITEAEAAQAEAAKALEVQQRKLAQAQAEAERILAEAQVSAERTKEAILAKSALDVQRTREDASKDLAVEQERVISQLRRRAAIAAIEQVNNQLRSRLNPEQQRELVDRSLSLIQGGGN